MLELFPSSTAGPFGRRAKRERGARIPVTVVTGFLGAGKTTLVRRFLGTPQGAGTAVIVNEFGETGIDDALLRASSDNIALLGNGCLCCNVRSDLQVTLHRLVADRERGVIPHFSRIVIETSGLADPSPILTTFATDRALGAEFHIEAVITVIAAQSGIDTIAAFAEARRQVILADRIVISKADIADDEAPAKLAARLRELNPRADIIEAVQGDLDPDWILAEGQGATGFVATEAGHTDGIASFTIIESRADRLGAVRLRDGSADRAARPRPVAGEGRARRRRLPRSRRRAVRAAPRPSPGRARPVAGRCAGEPPGVHRPQSRRGGGEGFVRRDARGGGA